MEGVVPDFDRSPYPPPTVAVSLDAASLGLPSRLLRTSLSTISSIQRRASTPSDLKLTDNSTRKSPVISPRKF